MDEQKFEEFLNEQYREEDRTFQIIKTFAVIGILIAVLGVLGLIRAFGS